MQQPMRQDDDPKRDTWLPPGGRVGHGIGEALAALRSQVITEMGRALFKIVAELANRDTYKLDLPEVIANVHPWFHVSRLKRTVAPGSSEAVPERNGEWEVERVLRAKHTDSQGWKFLVRWKGYTAADDTWEPEARLANAKEAIAQYMRLHKRHRERYYRDAPVHLGAAHVVKVGRPRSASF